MPETIFNAPTLVGASRVKGAHTLLRQVRQLALRSARALKGRVLSEGERSWLSRLYDTTRELASEGERVVTSRPEPKIERRARKRGR